MVFLHDCQGQIMIVDRNKKKERNHMKHQERKFVYIFQILKTLFYLMYIYSKFDRI